jgi:hypothetical protein
MANDLEGIISCRFFVTIICQHPILRDGAVRLLRMRMWDDDGPLSAPARPDRRPRGVPAAPSHRSLDPSCGTSALCIGQPHR